MATGMPLMGGPEFLVLSSLANVAQHDRPKATTHALFKITARSLLW